MPKIITGTKNVGLYPEAAKPESRILLLSITGQTARNGVREMGNAVNVQVVAEEKAAHLLLVETTIGKVKEIGSMKEMVEGSSADVVTMWLNAGKVVGVDYKAGGPNILGFVTDIYEECLELSPSLKVTSVKNPAKFYNFNTLDTKPLAETGATPEQRTFARGFKAIKDWMTNHILDISYENVPLLDKEGNPETDKETGAPKVKRVAKYTKIVNETEKAVDKLLNMFKTIEESKLLTKEHKAMLAGPFALIAKDLIPLRDAGKAEREAALAALKPAEEKAEGEENA